MKTPFYKQIILPLILDHKKEKSKQSFMMENILKAIKCVNCNLILSTPILLPCTHSVCKKHVSSETKSIQCGKCGQEHKVPESGQFPLNEPLNEIIEANIEALNFGKNHKEAREACKKLNETLDEQVNLLVNDPESVAYDEIGDLKRRVNLKREKLLLQINQEADKLIVMLEACNVKTEKSNAELSKLKEVKQAAKNELEAWTNLLNMVDQFHENRWAEIKHESEKIIEKLKEQYKIITSEMLPNEEKMEQIHFFENINVDSAFDSK